MRRTHHELVLAERRAFHGPPHVRELGWDCVGRWRKRRPHGGCSCEMCHPEQLYPARRARIKRDAIADQMR